MGKLIKNVFKLGMLGGAVYGAYKVKKRYDYVNDIYNDVIKFTGERIVYDDVFEGDSVAAFCAGLEIDLSEMIMEVDMVNLDIYGFCSGIKVIVPEGIHVVATGTAQAGAAEVDVAEYDNDDILTLNINYDITMSGLEIVTKYDEDESDETEATDADEVASEDEGIKIEVEVASDDTVETEDESVEEPETDDVSDEGTPE